VINSSPSRFILEEIIPSTHYLRGQSVEFGKPSFAYDKNRTAIPRIQFVAKCKRMRICSGKKAKDEIRQITMTNYCVNNPHKYDTNINIKEESKTNSSLVEFKPGHSIIENQYVVML